MKKCAKDPHFILVQAFFCTRNEPVGNWHLELAIKWLPGFTRLRHNFGGLGRLKTKHHSAVDLARRTKCPSPACAMASSASQRFASELFSISRHWGSVRISWNRMKSRCLRSLLFLCYLGSSAAQGLTWQKLQNEFRKSCCSVAYNFWLADQFDWKWQTKVDVTLAFIIHTALLFAGTCKHGLLQNAFKIPKKEYSLSFRFPGFQVSRSSEGIASCFSDVPSLCESVHFLMSRTFFSGSRLALVQAMWNCSLRGQFSSDK